MEAVLGLDGRAREESRQLTESEAGLVTRRTELKH